MTPSSDHDCAHCGAPGKPHETYCPKCLAWYRGDWKEVRAIDAGERDPQLERGAA